MGCNNTTVYLNGAQVSLSDLSRVWINGELATPHDLAAFTGTAMIRVESRFGTSELEFDGSRAHGRAGRTVPLLSDPVLAALALSNQASHPVPKESLPHAKKVARAALKAVSDQDLSLLLADEDATGNIRALGGPVFHLRRVRLAPSEPVETAPDPQTEFERNAANGVAGRPSSWAQAAVLARIDGRRFAKDRHPLVRTAAMYGLREKGLAEALVRDPAAAVRRTAAHLITSRIGVPLSATGRIAGRTAEARTEVLFLDIDGTLCEGVQHIDRESIELLESARQRGLVVVAVTDRSPAAFSVLGLDADLVCSSGVLWDPVSKSRLADVPDKAGAVDAVCALLETSSVAAVGGRDGDTPLFEKVRASNGACGWPVTGEPGPALLATDLLGGVGSGSIGRFALDLLDGAQRPVVPAISVQKPTRTNYSAHLLSRTDLEKVIDDSMLPHGWEMAHGHVTLDYPRNGAPVSSLAPVAPAESVLLLGKVVTDEVTAFVVEVDKRRTQADGSPLHVTVGLGVGADGKRVSPVKANKATALALETDSVVWFDKPVHVRAVPAPAGAHASRIDRDVEDALLDAAAPEEPVRRALAAGLKEGLMKANRELGSSVMQDPVTAALASGDRLERGLVALSGIPASGKSTAARELVSRHGAVVVSLDAIREEVNGDAGDQSNLRTVLAVAKARIETELTLGRLVVSDATNVEARVLRELVETAHRNDLPAVVARVDVSREEALRRDEARHNQGHRALGNSLPHHIPGDPWDGAHAAAVIDKMLTRHSDVSRALNEDRLGADAVCTVTELLGS